MLKNAPVLLAAFTISLGAGCKPSSSEAQNRETPQVQATASAQGHNIHGWDRMENAEFIMRDVPMKFLFPRPGFTTTRDVACDCDLLLRQGDVLKRGDAIPTNGFAMQFNAETEYTRRELERLDVASGNARDGARASMRGEGEEPLKLTGHLAARGKIAGVNMWGGMVSGAKTLRRGTDRAFTKHNMIIGAGVAAACVGLDIGGAGNEFTDAVSGLTGGGIASSTTIATFLNFNFWEDIVGVHIGTGVGLLFSGAAAGYGYKRGIRPALLTGLETKPGQAVQHAYEQVASRVSAVAEDVGERLDRKNEALGRYLTEQAVKAQQGSAFEPGR